MDIKGYLNEKLKNNKVAEKAKRLTATALVAGTILTGAGLTACEQKLNMSNEELASGIVEILQNQNEDLELSNIIFSSVDNKYMMIVGNFDMSEYVGYEVSKSQFNKLLKLAKEKNSDYIQVSPNGDSFVITEGGINDENLKEFNEIIYSTISKGNTIDVSKYMQTSENFGQDIDVDKLNNKEKIEYFLNKQIKTCDHDNEYSDFKQDYIRVYSDLNGEKKYYNNQFGEYLVRFENTDLLEFVDEYSQNGQSDKTMQKVVAIVVDDDSCMNSLINLLKTNEDNERIKKINDGYLVDVKIFEDESMSDISFCFEEILNGNSKFVLECSYTGSLQQEIEEPSK